MDDLRTSRNGDKKYHVTYQDNKWTCHGNGEVISVPPVQMNIEQGNTYRKDLNWLHFGDEPRAQMKQ